MAFAKAVLTLPILLGSAWAASGDPLAVTKVRYWSLGDVTRIAVEFNGSFKYSMTRLDTPNRVFFDLGGARHLLNDRGIHIIHVKDSRVKQIRVAETQPRVTRVVIDLDDRELDVIASQLSLPERLMIEVRTISESAPKPVPLVTGVKKTPEPQLDPVPSTVSGVLQKPTPPVVAGIAQKPTSRASTPPIDLGTTRKRSTVDDALPEPPPLPVTLGNPTQAAEPAKRNGNGDRSLTRVLGLKIRRVVIDAGHGGHDHGTTGVTGLAEKDLVLDVAKRLGALIKDELGSDVVYTRSSDTFVSLEDRTRIANAQKADLFLSIHANSSPIKSATGFESYYLNFTNSRPALELAARENAASEYSISELKELVQKIALRAKAEESREFAAKIQSAMNENLSSAANRNRTRDRGVKRAPFVVLINAGMPSVLVELGFLTNSKEESLFKKADHRQKVAEALLRGISDYANTLSKFQVAKTDRPVRASTEP